MARIVLTDVSVTINSVDLSSHIASVTIETNFDEVETTAFGNTARTRVAGLQDSSVSLDFHQDFAASEVEATIYPLLGTTTAVVIKPDSGAVAADNPSYSFDCLVNQWTPLGGGIGELATASVTWPISGAITKATA
jgi:hypothetical protein